MRLHAHYTMASWTLLPLRRHLVEDHHQNHMKMVVEQEVARLEEIHRAQPHGLDGPPPALRVSSKGMS